MRIFTPLKAGVCLAALMTGHAASADVTAAEVWANWKENIAIYGQDGVTIGSEDASGGTVTVSGISLSMSDADASVTADLGQIVFSENGDGTVSITMANSYPISIEGDGATVDITVSQTGLDMLASGTPEAVNYQISADQYSIVVDEITERGESQIDGDIRMVANGLNGNYTVTSGEMRDISYAVSTDSIDLLADITEPGGEGRVLVSGKMSDMSASALITLPADVDFEDPEALLASGFSIEGGYGLKSANYIFDVDADGEQAAGTLSMGLAEVSILFNDTRMGYDAVSNDIAVDISSGELPFPVKVSLAQYGLGVNLPVSAADTPEPFSFGINMTDLSVNDEIWMMGDPAGQLSHDPVTMRVDLSGEGRWFYDLLDPSQADALSRSDMPGELTALSLNDLTLRALGAAVTGSGGFTFDNSDMVTIPGVPRPMGEVTVNIDGANKLIDSLAAMGLVPEQEAGMGRMMMGMFARTVGDDQLTSTIEINDQGHILANGQRIQ